MRLKSNNHKILKLTRKFPHFRLFMHACTFTPYIWPRMSVCMP